MTARLLYVMDPMCSWCWGFAPVFEALAAQAQAAGVAAQLLVGGLRPGTRQALDAATRGYILEHWQAVAERTDLPFRFSGNAPEKRRRARRARRDSATRRRRDPFGRGAGLGGGGSCGSSC